MNNNIKGTLFAVMAAFFWSTQVLFTRLLNAMGLFSLEIAQVRLLVCTVALGGYLVLFDRSRLKIKRGDLWVFLCSGLLCVFWFGILYFAALERINIPTASALISLTPIYVTLNSALLFHEKITRNKAIALLLSIVGCTMVSGVLSGFHGSLIGVLMAIGAGIVYSYYSIFSRIAINRGYVAWTIVFYSFLFAFVGNSFLADWNQIGSVLVSSGNAWMLYLGLGLFTGFFSYICYSKALEYMETSRVSLAETSESVFCVLIGIFGFGEWPDFVGLLGIILILFSLLLLNCPEKAKKET